MKDKIETQKEPGQTKRKRMILLALIVACTLGGAWYFQYARTVESTDDAYVSGVIVPVACEIRGKVAGVFVRDNQAVAAGTPLLSINREDYQHIYQQKDMSIARLQAETGQIEASMEQARKVLLQAGANLEAARTEGQLAAKDMDRYERLIAKEIISRSQYDTVQSRWEVCKAREKAAEAGVAEAQAALKTLETRLKTQSYAIHEAEAARNLARLDLERTTILAPVSGRIAKKNVEPGKYVQTGQPLLSIVQDETWVVANFKETQIKKMASGQAVSIRVDAYPGLELKGRLDSIQPGTGATFSLIPPENATGNFVKVVQRIPVKIILETPPDPAHPLWPGLSVIATVDVSRSAGPKLAGR